MGVAKLLRPRADVVAARVAQHVLPRFLLEDVSARLADDDGEFGLVVARAVLADFGHADLLRVRAAQRRPRLDEQDRVTGDGHLSFAGVVAVVETEAADDGGFVDRDGREELGDGHFLVRDEAVEYGAGDEVGLDRFLFDGCEAEVGVGFGVDLSQVHLAIFLGDEANEMGPIWWHDGRRRNRVGCCMSLCFFKA